MGHISRRYVLGTATMVASALAGCGFGREVEGGHLFIENRRGESERVEISVTETESSEQLVHNEYEIPEFHAIQYEEILEPNSVYEIRASQPEVRGAGHNRLNIEITSCQEGDPSDRLDVSVLVGSNGPDIIVYDCDRVYEKQEDLTYEDPSEYEVGTLTGPVDTPTESDSSTAAGEWADTDDSPRDNRDAAE